MGQVDDVRPRCVKRTSDGDNGHDVNNDDINNDDNDDDDNNDPDYHDDCLSTHSDGDHLGTCDVGSRCDEYTEHGTRHNEGVDNVILNNCTAHHNNDDGGAAHYNDNDHNNDHYNDHYNDHGAAHHLFGHVQRQYEWRWGSAYGWHRIREWRDGDSGRQHRVVDEGGLQLWRLVHHAASGGVGVRRHVARRCINVRNLDQHHVVCGVE